MRIILCIICLVLPCLVSSTPLDDYVKAPDPHYKYELLKSYELEGYKLFILNLTSQKWLDESVTNQPIWWHFLTITVPNKLTRPDAAGLVIDGGNNDNPTRLPYPYDNSIAITSLFAVGTGSITANLEQVPNQPVIFKKDPTQKSRREDAIIAWTWKSFIENTSDPEILLRLPMTKAAYKAMDAMTDFCQKNKFANLKKFFIAGASKRGWTTWTTAAVDNERVFAAAPFVMDFLNLNENLHTHFKSLGGWTWAFGDYYTLNITKYVDTPQMFEMQKIIDPYFYLDRYKKTKFLVFTTSGDEFFLPGDTHNFWGNLVEVTDGSVLLRRLPNAEHEMIGHEVGIFLNMVSFYMSAYDNYPLPSVKWTMPNNRTHGIIRATVDITKGPAPADVKVYYAETLDNKRIDFRLVSLDPDTKKPALHPVVWKSTTTMLNVNATRSKAIYEAVFEYPITGWLGFFIQFSFPGLENSMLQVSTETNVIPNIYPFDDCYRDSCLGDLV